MRTIETTIYTFDELSDKAKQWAIDKWNETNDMPFLSDDMHEHLGELLQKHKIKSDDAHCFYSLSYSQGDGAMFTGTFSWKGYTFKVQHYGHYYHENSKDIWEITRNNGNDISSATWSKMFKEFESLYVEICKALRDYGYDYIEHEQDPKNVAENIRANDYEFYADGSMV